MFNEWSPFIIIILMVFAFICAILIAYTSSRSKRSQINNEIEPSPISNDDKSYTCQLTIDPRIYGVITIIDFMNYLNELVFKNYSQVYLMVMPNPIFLDKYTTAQLKYMFIAAPNTIICKTQYSNGIAIVYRTGELIECANKETMYPIYISITAKKSKIAVRYMKNLLIGYCKYMMDNTPKKDSTPSDPHIYE